MPAPDAITPAQLTRLIGTPDCPQIVDISIEPDFVDDPFLIPGWWRHSHADLPGLIDRLDARPATVVCQQGTRLSQGLVSWLRSAGIEAEYLEGGKYGWRDLPGCMRIPANALPDPVNGATLWVTRHRPKIDRIACPWMIRRFIDPQAQFLFVSPSEVIGVADKYGAQPFDVEGMFWSHRGDTCTFDKMLTEFQLNSDALARLVSVVRGADTSCHDLHPSAAGLLAFSVGLSRHYRDDHQQLDAAMPLNDALYRWARDGQDETHDWPADRT